MIYNITYSPRFTRMVKSYAPVKNGLTELLGIDGPDRQPTWVFCKEKRKYYRSDEFYVKKYRQDYDSKYLSPRDFRHICKEVWDQKVRNQKNGLGWKSDEQLFEESSTLESFIKETENA